MKSAAVLTFVAVIVLAFATNAEINRDPWKIDWSRVVSRSALDHKGNLIDPNYKFTQDVSSRIYNGVVVPAHWHPYAISLVVSHGLFDVFCQGALLSELTVITTAYCVFGTIYTFVVAGAHNITDYFEETQQSALVFEKDYRIHPSYLQNLPDNNIAILQLCPFCASIRFNQYVQPIQLAPRNLVGQSLAGETATFVGNVNQDKRYNSV